MLDEGDRVRDRGEGCARCPDDAAGGSNPAVFGRPVPGAGPAASGVGPAGDVADASRFGLPSLLELRAESRRRAIVAFATRAAGPVVPGGVESWDITVCGEAYEPLAADPFSFAGDFLDAGLNALMATLFDPAGFAFEFLWIPGFGGSGYHAVIQSTR